MKPYLADDRSFIHPLGHWEGNLWCPHLNKNMIELETWTSDKGKQELHHFLAADPQTYVYGVNAQLLGPQACELIRNIVTGRLLELTEGGFRVHGVKHERLTLD